MEKTVDIAALGELLIDFTESGVSTNGTKLFEQNPGGAPANLLTVASHMGYHTEFIGKVGSDMHGDYLKQTLQAEGIGTCNLLQDSEYFTTLAFVSITPDGERRFSFARKPGADTQLQTEELRHDLLSNCKIFHFGSLSLTDEPARTATIEAVKTAKNSGALISYDPNYRETLWKNQDFAAKQMNSMIPYADVMKVSDEEAFLLTECTDYELAANQLLAAGPTLVAITLGKNGVLLADQTHIERIPGFSVTAIDTTGAGDSFWGGFLSHFLSFEKSMEEITWMELKECAIYGNATAALCVQKRGGIPAIPSKKDLFDFINPLLNIEKK